MFSALRRLLVALLILLVFAGAAVYWQLGRPIELAGESLEFHIVQGSTLRSAGRQIADAGVRISPWLFEAYGRLEGASSRIKAGSYEVQRGITLPDLMGKLTRGDVTSVDLTVPEGWTFRQLRQALDQHPGARHDTAGKSDAEVLNALGMRDVHPEGLFFPDTYVFARGTSDLAVLKRAQRAMQRHLSNEWEGRDPAAPYRSPYEALIMASIIEKETGRAADRAMIAAVFANRLRKNMLLQTDPTVIYGLGPQFDGNLRRRDLERDMPYNTYTRPGLPPTPIALPGLDSLHAALHPGQSDALYFVARGDGTSHFSNSLQEHNAAVERFQKRPRKTGEGGR